MTRTNNIIIIQASTPLNYSIALT